MSYASPAIAIVLMLIGGLLLFLFLGKNPIEGFKVFFISPISDLWGVSELLLKATPLMLIAVGLAIGFRANVWNIGAEGQLVVGGIAASAVALYFQEAEGAHVLILMVIAGAIGGMLWAAIPAFLKTRFNTNEILVSLMLVYVSQLLVSWLVHGPMMDPDGFNFPQSAMFADSALLPLIVRRRQPGQPGLRIRYRGAAGRLHIHVPQFCRLSDAGCGICKGRRALCRVFGQTHDLDRAAQRRRHGRTRRYVGSLGSDGADHRPGIQ
jgi:ABC-type uncharacterized transport system permease subunit